jgi:hypothetical protein
VGSAPWARSPIIEGRPKVIVTTWSTGRRNKVRRAFARRQRPLKFHLKAEISDMSRIVVVTAAIAGMVAAIIAWSKLTVVEPEASVAATNAEAAEGPPIISPFDIMLKQGKHLPVEDWRPAN